MSKRTCEGCGHHSGKRVGGYCHRYPVPVKVKLTHWCGEWRQAPIKCESPKPYDFEAPKVSFSDPVRATILKFHSPFSSRDVWYAMPKILTHDREYHSGRTSVQRCLRQMITEGLVVEVSPSVDGEAAIYRLALSQGDPK